MNNRVVFAALLIAMLATTTAYASPASATSGRQGSYAPERNMSAPPNLVIPTNNVKYNITGLFYAWINLTQGFASLTSNFPGLSSFNVSIPEFYLRFGISLSATNIVFDLSDPVHPVVTGNVNVTATIDGRFRLYVNESLSSPPNADVTIHHWWSANWVAKYFIPWGSVDNFTSPLPVFNLDPSRPDPGTAEPIQIKFDNSNNTFSSPATTWKVHHATWDFGDWLKNRIETAYDQTISNLTHGFLNGKSSGIGIQTSFNVDRSVGRIDLWKADANASGNIIQNVFLMGSALVDILAHWQFVVSNFHLTGGIFGIGYSGTLNLNLAADMGLYYNLVIVNSLGSQLTSSTEINTVNVYVPVNSTFAWRKVGVIVYYGSPSADAIDVTAGISWGNTTYGGERLFFVDYGWDGTPDFATNGTGQPIRLIDRTGAISGTGNSRQIAVNKDYAGQWICFNLTIPAGWNVSEIHVYRVVNGANEEVNVTQYWTRYGVLYVCDDPAYTYSVEVVTPSGTSLLGALTLPILVGVVAIVVVASALAVVKRRRSSSVVHIK